VSSPYFVFPQEYRARLIWFLANPCSEYVPCCRCIGNTSRLLHELRSLPYYLQKTYIVKSSNAAKSSEWRSVRNKLVDRFPKLETYVKSVVGIHVDRIQFSTDKYIGSLYLESASHNLIALEPCENVLLPSLMSCWKVR
jgi:hypothetical protein